ncbi:MAG TPA: hypothetical protein VKB92_09900 [Myxococcales bacterium]|nr:hypothetical protein [Myxococcales bacterium]
MDSFPSGDFRMNVVNGTDSKNEVDAAGGLSGSFLRATYTATVAYVVQ